MYCVLCIVHLFACLDQSGRKFVFFLLRDAGSTSIWFRVSQWRSLKYFTVGSKTYIPKNFYRTGGSKTYIPKNFYTKTTYITLLAEKFGGRAPLPAPSKHRPWSESLVSNNRKGGGGGIVHGQMGFTSNFTVVSTGG
ncbi:hypothetical protein Hanom_Chr05g00424731 [Helianthus anomalus]